MRKLVVIEMLSLDGVSVIPVVLGSGKRLFRDPDEPLRLTLLESTPTSTGGMLLTYGRAN